jgi:ribosomal protein L20A (L18A)
VKISTFGEDGEGRGELRARAPEVRDTDIDDALEEAWGAVGARQGSKRSKVFIVHFDNRKSKECQYEWIYIHLRNETEN